MLVFVLNMILALVKLPAVDAATVEARCKAAELARYCAIAGDIEAVVRAEPVAFDGPGAQEAAATALVAVAWHESGFKAGVQDCSICTGANPWCDRGRSVSLFQLHEGRAWQGHKREALCSDNRLAATLAHRLLTANARKTRNAIGMFIAYAGSGRGAVRAGGEIYAIFERRLDRAGFRFDHRKAPLFVVAK